jgi:hypothetical protein
VALAAAPFAGAQSSGPAYLVEKGQIFNQTSASAPSADANAPYIFYYQAAASDPLTPPGGSAITPVYVAGNSDYEIDAAYSSLGNLNTAFPDGNFSVSGTGVPATQLTVNGGIYPTTTPQITGGTWQAGGVLIFDATVANTLNFNTFSGYSSTSGSQVGAHEQVKIYPLNSGGNSIGQEIATQSVFGLTQASSPFTSYTVAANALANGNIYLLKLDYDALSNLDTTSLSAAGLVGLYRKEAIAFIATQTGTTVGDTPPAITAQPVSLTGTSAVPIGGTATFTVGVGYDSKSAVLFVGNGQILNIDGVKYAMNTTSTSVQLSINNVAATDAGSYFAYIVNPGGVVESQAATLATSPAVAPTLTSDLPAAVSINSGSSVVLTPVFTGNPSYQWYLNGVALTDSPSGTTSDIISGSTGPQLEIKATTVASAGTYTVKATNSAGSVTSGGEVLTVTSVTNPGYLVNISSRAFVGTGDSILIGGFFVGGKTSRTVLIQAMGPALISQGVSGTLALPALTIHDSTGATIYANTGWGSSPVLLAAAKAAYATPVLTANSNDSELLLTLPPGGYTAEIAGADGGTGVALCAVYEMK